MFLEDFLVSGVHSLALLSLALDFEESELSSFLTTYSYFTLGLCYLRLTEFDLYMNFFNCFLWKTMILRFIILEWISFLNLKHLKLLAIMVQASYSPFVQISLFLRIMLVTGMVTTVRSGNPLDPQNWLLLSIIKPNSLTFLFITCGLKFRSLSCSLSLYFSSSRSKVKRI